MSGRNSFELDPIFHATGGFASYTSAMRQGGLPAIIKALEELIEEFKAQE